MLSKKRLLVKRVASEGVTIVKDVELKLISELMKDSRRSDRELAKAIGVSQPTISRMIRKIGKGRHRQRIHDDTQFQQAWIRNTGHNLC